MTQILSGVNYIHQSKIIHRDLKAANILIDGKGNFKITDFGISKELASIKDYASTGIGTLWYSSIEVLRSENYNYTADIWSLGCIFHEMCCLKPPFTETDMFDFIEVLKKENYNSDEIPDEYSPDIKNMIISMLSFNRRARPSCEELLKTEILQKYVKSSKKVYAGKYNGVNNYEGKIKDGKKHGKGVFFYINGMKYDGEWKDNERNGVGILYYTDGGRYEGEWKDDKKHNVLCGRSEIRG